MVLVDIYYIRTRWAFTQNNIKESRWLHWSLNYIVVLIRTGTYYNYEIQTGNWRYCPIWQIQYQSFLFSNFHIQIFSKTYTFFIRINTLYLQILFMHNDSASTESFHHNNIIRGRLWNIQLIIHFLLYFLNIYSYFWLVVSHTFTSKYYSADIRIFQW